MKQNVINHFNKKGIVPKRISHEKNASLIESADLCELPHHKIVRASLLQCEDEKLLVLLPLNAIISFELLEKITAKIWHPVATSNLKLPGQDAAETFIIPIPELYRIPGLIDESLFSNNTLYFEAGDQKNFYQLTNKEFIKLMVGYNAASFAIIIDNQQQGLPDREMPFMQQLKIPSDKTVKRRMNQLHRLPAMPAVAVKILKVVAQPETKIAELASLIEIDPSMSAQVMRYARSSYFGYQGKVDSIQKAISRVLGFDVVSNLALGIAAGRAFRLNTDGPLGINKFWKAAVFTAALSQSLSRLCHPMQLNSGTAYLAGLLHNFGVLVLAELFQNEYYLLNKLSTSFPDCPLDQIEDTLMTANNQELAEEQSSTMMSHTYLGSWLMKYWNMPETIIITNSEHHNPNYEGDDEQYVWLLRIVLNLLAKQGIGDIGKVDSNNDDYQKLGLTEELCQQQYQRLLENSVELEKIATLIGENSAE